MLRRAVGIVVVVLASVGASAAPALGATRFASPAITASTTGNCTEIGNNPACAISYALSQAANGDTLSLASGSYVLGSTLDITKKLSIVATDPTMAKPFLLFTGNSNFKLDTGSGGSSVAHLSIQSQVAGLTVVQVLEGASFTDDAIFSEATCLSALGASQAVTLTNVDATQNGSVGGYTCLQGGGGVFTVTHTSVSAPIGAGVSVIAGSVTDSTISAATGLELAGGLNTPAPTARRDTISGSTVGVELSSSALITDSVVTTGTGVAVDTTSTGTAENVTAIGTGAGSIGFEALSLPSPLIGVGTLLVRNSIARAVADDIKADPAPATCLNPPPCKPGQLSITHSDFVTSSGTIDDQGANISADPRFASASDYHLTRGSPAIDGGAATGNTGTTDLSGKPRVVGPAVDMGAYEFQGGLPIAQTFAATAITATSAVLHGTVDPGDLATSAGFNYGIGRNGFDAFVVAPAPPLSDAPEPISAKLSNLSPGHTYLVGVYASNALGAVDGSPNILFSTPRLPNPRVSAASVSPPRFRDTGRRRKLAHIRFTLSEAAAVRITFTRAAPGVRSKHACVAPGKRHVPRRSRCTRYVGVPGVVELPNLAAGSHSIKFSGHLTKFPLGPGTYRATIVAIAGATSGGPHSKPLTIKFTIIR